MDHPLEECAARAYDLVLQGHTFWQKWTCPHCDSRQTMEQPNTFFRKGKCENCGAESTITKCNYMVHIGREKCV